MASAPEWDSGWAQIFIGSIGATLGAVATFVAHGLHSRTSMASIIDARIRLLIDSYEKRIEALEEETTACAARTRELEAEIANLHLRSEALMLALNSTRVAASQTPPDDIC